MSTTAPSYTPEELERISAGRVLADRFYDECIKPTARESAGTVASSDPTRCQCATPIPIDVTDDPNLSAAYACDTCHLNLRSDENGRPYRRFCGDLDTEEQIKGREVLKAANAQRAEMRELVNSLPRETQKRLIALPPKRFQKIARKMIRIREELKKSAQIKDPNTRRRLQRLGENYAQIVDRIASQMETI